MSTRSLVTAVTVFALGCSAAHGRVPGIDPNTPIVTMTHEQWVTVCDWREELRSGEQLLYYCDPATGTVREDVSEEDCRAGGLPRPCYDWRASQCEALGFGSEYGMFRSTPVPRCPATLEEYAACWETLASDPCYRSRPETEECEHFWSRCELGPDPDAGGAIDGG